MSGGDSRFLGWLRFFRIVNLPTVPGDVCVGAAAVVWGVAGGGDGALAVAGPAGIARAVAAAAVAACALYFFGLADNDIAGAATDGPERPIPAGAVSLGAARLARGLCLFAVLAVAAAANLPPLWWGAAFALAVASVVYNRTKCALAMGLCRGLDVVCGGAALLGGPLAALPRIAAFALAGAAVAATLYITLVTRYSEGEAASPAKRRTVGMLIGALIYLQLGALLAVYCAAPLLVTRNLLLVGAAMLVLLRLLRRTLPEVSAS